MASRHPSHSTDSAANVKSKESKSVSLGKLSFKQRLESYYSVVQPDLISCPIQWGTRFDQIWDKFGGTIEGEQLLAAKLMKKYGQAAISFQTVSSPSSGRKIIPSHGQKISQPNANQHANEWYKLNEKELNSGCLNFLSDRFNPVAALQPKNSNEVETLNPFILSVPMLDRVDLFRPYLPICDPLHQRKFNNRNSKIPSNRDSSIGLLKPNSTIKNITANESTLRHVPICFVDTVKWHETGPYSILYDALVNKYRIRVLVRYVNSIRGTLTGYVTAFDQHMNLLLRDVDEQYCPRRTTNEDTSNENTNHQEVESLSNGQAEVQRRIACISQSCSDLESHTTTKSQKQQHSKGSSWTIRQRHMSQIMVRGDVIVLIYKVSEERSAWSVSTNEFQPKYRKVEQPSRIGTPGSFVIPDNQRHSRKPDRNRDKSSKGNSNKSDYNSNF